MDESKLNKYESETVASSVAFAFGSALIGTAAYKKYGGWTPLARAPGSDSQKATVFGLLYVIYAIFLLRDSEETKRELLESHGN